MIIANLFFFVFFVLFCWENDPFAEVVSFNLLAGGLEIALGSDEHNMRQKVARYYQKHHIDFPPKVKIHEICFLQQEKLILEHISRFQMKG